MLSNRALKWRAARLAIFQHSLNPNMMTIAFSTATSATRRATPSVSVSSLHRRVFAPTRRADGHPSLARPTPKRVSTVSFGALLSPPADSARLPASQKKKIVVVGSGWGAASFVASLDPALFGDEGAYELVVVSPRDYFVYTPLLPAVASGAIDAASVTTPMHDIVGNRGRFVRASVKNFDFGKKMLACERTDAVRYVEPSSCEAGGACDILEREEIFEFDMAYDILVSAIGAETATFGVPGVEEHCISIRTAQDSDRLRRCFEDALKRACSLDSETNFNEIRRLMSAVVIGGGPTGVEVAAELQEMLDSGYESFCSTHNYCAPLWPTVYLVTNTPALLPTFSENVSKYATKRLRDTGVVEMLDSIALEVEEDAVRVQDMKTGREKYIDAATIVWAGGVKASELTTKVSSHFSEKTGVTAHRGVVVDERLRPNGSDGSVFWIGDAAATSAVHSEQLPPTAQVARAQGEYIAGLFNSGAVTFGPRGEVLSSDAPEFSYASKGAMAYVGRGAAAIDFPGGKALTGHAAGLLWKAYETVSQFTAENKIAVACDFISNKREIRDSP
jgi:NADH:ubiquinone reductase (non-electrogenic)